MRQIESLSRFVFSVLLGKEPESTVQLTEEAPTTGEPAPLRAQLAALVRAEKLCEAENLLFEALEAEDPEVLPAALEFYRALNGLPDETLERCGFPRDEILSGLREVCSLCGLDLSALD